MPHLRACSACNDVCCGARQILVTVRTVARLLVSSSPKKPRATEYLTVYTAQRIR